MAFVGPDKPSDSIPPASKRFIGPDQNMVETTNNPPEQGLLGRFLGPEPPIGQEGIGGNLIRGMVESFKSGTPQPLPPANKLYNEPGLQDVTVSDAANVAAAGSLAKAGVKSALSEIAPAIKGGAVKTATKGFVGPDATVQTELPISNPSFVTPQSPSPISIKPPVPESQNPTAQFAPDLRELWARAATEQSGTPLDESANYIRPDLFNKPGEAATGNTVKTGITRFSKGTMGKGPNAITIWGVKGGTPEQNLELFGDKEPGSVPEHTLDKLGIPEELAPSVAPFAPEVSGPSTKIQFSPKQMGQINKAMGSPAQPELPGTAVKNPPVPPIPTDPIVKGFGDEMAMGKISDRFVPGVSDMNRQFSLVATNPETASTGSLQQAKNSVTQAETRVGQQYNNYLRQLDKFGIDPGSKESEAMFHYIEGNKSKEELVDQFGTKMAGTIDKEATFMRKQYDIWLDEINGIRETKGLKPISRKDNYINHMDEMSSVGTDLIDKIKGDSDLTEAAQKAMAEKDAYRVAEPDVSFRHIIRKGGETAEDAITSFRKYIYDGLNYREMQPEVERLNQMSDLARANKMPNIANRLEDYSGYVAGKPQLLDKLAADTVGKPTLALINKLSKNTTYSVISFNPSVWAAQMIRLFPKIMQEGISLNSFKAGLKLFSSEARAQAFDNVPFLAKMFTNREEAAITGGFGGSSIPQRVERLGANIPAYVDQSFAMHTAILSHDAKLAELVGKYPLTDKALLDKQAWLYAEHNVENYQALISKSATPPYFRSKTSKILTPLMREATLMTDFLYHDVLRNSGDISRATQAARAFAGLTAMAAMGSVMEFMGGEDQKPLLGKALFPMLKALESSLSMVKTAAAPLTAAKAFVEGKGTLGNVVKSTGKSYILARGTPGGLQLIKALDSLFGD